MTEKKKGGQLRKIRFDISKNHHIAYCHESNPSANNWHQSLILKAQDNPQPLPELLETLIKQRDEVQVRMSMREFLQKFFSMYYTDAAMLAELLGFDGFEDEEVETIQDIIDERLEGIEILKSLNSADDCDIAASQLDIEDYMSVLNTQVVLEKQEDEKDDDNKSRRRRRPRRGERARNNKNTRTVRKSGDSMKEKNQPGQEVGDEVVLTKAQHEELLAQLSEIAELKKAANKVKDLEQVLYEQQVERQAEFTKSLGFIAEQDEQVAVATTLVKMAATNPEGAKVITDVLKKAKSALDAALTQSMGADGEGEDADPEASIQKSVMSYLAQSGVISKQGGE